MNELLNYSKAGEIMIYLYLKDKKTASQIGRDLLITTSYVSKTLGRLEKLRLIKIGDLVGRSKPVKITQKGESIAINLIKIEGLLK